MPGPLEGIRVVDFSAVVSGPLATMLLAEQGAEVVKVEAPDRPDMLRREWYSRGGLTSLFANVNRGKRSLVVDLRDERGLAAVHELCRRADVVLENFRPGVAERLKIGPEDLHALNPRLVYCRVTGFGPSGPFAKRRAYDPIIQGLAGWVAIQKNPELPVPDLVRNVAVDKAAAYSAAQAITAALLARERGELGQVVSVSLLDAGLAFFWPDGMMKHTLIGDDVREGPAIYDRYRLTETRDGHVVMWAGGDDEWHAVFRGLGRPELCQDERFATGRARSRNAEALGALVYDEFRKWSTEEILQRMDEADAPCGPVLELEQVPDHPQTRHNESVFEVEHPRAGRMRQCRPAARFSRSQAGDAALAPLSGEHSDALLAELGLDDDEIESMRADGVIR